jgi:hypothetical protein
MTDPASTTLKPGAETFAHLGRSVAAIRAELGTDPVSVDAIRDPAIYELERRRSSAAPG